MSTVTPIGAPDRSTGVRLPSRLDLPSGRIPFGRLVAVEARKLVDTRSGRWLLFVTGLLTLAVVGVVALTGRPGADKDLADFLTATVLPQVFLLPIIGIMAVTAEWSQRTGLVTFVLEPRRPRVALAKLVAAIGTGLLVVVVGMAMAAVFTLVTEVVRGSDPDWTIRWSLVGAVALAQVLNVGMGFAFGALIQNTPGAIVAFLLLPNLWPVVTSIPVMRSVAPWVDTNRTLDPLFDGRMTALDWGHLAVSMALWVVLPLTLGIVRMVRKEVKSS